MALVQSTPVMAVLAVVLALLAYQVIVSIYRLTLHPLAKYPGPFLARISQWPEGWAAATLRRHLALDELHEKYGDVVRFSPNKLSFRTAKAWDDIYTNRHANMIKTGFTDGAIGVNKVMHTHNLRDRKLHHSRRKLLNFAFSDSALRNYEPRLVESVKFWCNQLSGHDSDNNDKSGIGEEGQWSQKRDMASWSEYLTVDILGQLCFSQDWAACKNQRSVWADVIPMTMGMISAIAFLPIRDFLYPFVSSDWFMAWIPWDNAHANIKFKASAETCVIQRFALNEAEKDKSDEDTSKDFFHYLTHAKNPETGETFQPQELVGEALLLLVAGSDTSSTALAACFFYLLRNPKVFGKLAREVRKAFKNVDDIVPSASEMKDLKFLRACIDESMRMSPPVPTLLDRIILPGGANIDGIYVPEGISVGVPIYTLQHREEYFEKPHEFVPDRWIEGASPAETGFDSVVTEASITKAKSAFVPFSTGTRGCVGKKLAYMELSTALARAVYLFDMRESEFLNVSEKDEVKLPRTASIREKNKDEYQLQDIFVAQKYGPVMELRQAQTA